MLIPQIVQEWQKEEKRQKLINDRKQLRGLIGNEDKADKTQDRGRMSWQETQLPICILSKKNQALCIKGKKKEIPSHIK